jgi:hypothetical protein
MPSEIADGKALIDGRAFVVQANVWYLICNDLFAKRFDHYRDYEHYVAAKLSNETV